MEFYEHPPQSWEDVSNILPLAAVFTVVLMVFIYLQPKRPRAIVTQLWVYPVKGCQGQRVEESEFDGIGFKRDRRYLVVRENEEDGADAFMTQRQLPRLALIQARYGDNEDLILTAGGESVTIPRVTPDDEDAVIRTVRVWNDAVPGAVDQGFEAADFLCNFLQTEGLRLVHQPTSCVRPIAKKFRVRGASNITSFADGFPFLLLSEESVAGLKARTSLDIPDVRRFRPNIVIRGMPSVEANAEDSWDRMTINGHTLFGVKKCCRCRVTTINPDDATGNNPELDPLKTFRTYRLQDDGESVCFGLNLVPKWNRRLESKRPTLNVGDAVVVESTSSIPYR